MDNSVSAVPSLATLATTSFVTHTYKQMYPIFTRFILGLLHDTGDCDCAKTLFNNYLHLLNERVCDLRRFNIPSNLQEDLVDKIKLFDKEIRSFGIELAKYYLIKPTVETIAFCLQNIFVNSNGGIDKIRTLVFIKCCQPESLDESTFLKFAVNNDLFDKVKVSLFPNNYNEVLSMNIDPDTYWTCEALTGKYTSVFHCVTAKGSLEAMEYFFKNIKESNRQEILRSVAENCYKNYFDCEEKVLFFVKNLNYELWPERLRNFVMNNLTNNVWLKVFLKDKVMLKRKIVEMD